MPTLFDTYQVDPGRYNEIFAADGSVHPHWHRFASTLQTMTAGQMQERADLVAQQIHENGVTYNVYADPQGMDRPWEVDPLPLLLSAQEWQAIEEARVRLVTRLNPDMEPIEDGPDLELGDEPVARVLRYSLGPSLGQCCGGIVWLALERVTP